MTQAPRYQAISQDLSEQISAGTLGSGDRLLSEQELASMYGVSRMTVRQALGQLESRGLVVRRHGSGTFVATPSHMVRETNRLGPYEDEIGVAHGSIKTQVTKRVVTQPDESVRESLRLSEGQTVVNLVRVRIHDGAPISIQESWIPLLLAPMIAREDLIDGSLYRTLRERAGVEVTWAEQFVRSVLATAEQAKLLHREIGCPLIDIRRVAFAADDTPVEVAHSVTIPELPLRMQLHR
ncbi:GntR family transcriptional regulator [Microbacterium sp. CJ77]|uniref:GntR family transcriptional regulator n=1 Tax=Microbacterium sp. CJ77 TaxID=2079201 RepID=UPI000CD84296|nr:GntR family transcriptional regulator [Microbacterium sp. CJ77]